MKKLLFFSVINVAMIAAVNAQIPSDRLTTEFGNLKIATYRNNSIPLSLSHCIPLHVETDNYGFFYTKPILGDTLIFNLTHPDDRCFGHLDGGINTSPLGNMNFQVKGVTKLSIRGSNGNIYIPYNVSLVFGPQLGEGTDRIRILHSGTHGYIDYKDNLHFRADKNWISALTLYGNGSVGVGFGTTYTAGQYLNMGYKLAVNGGIVCEEIKVIADVPDADYVFEEDYNLTPLSEVEVFIKGNKHLPNIPSAKEFKTNGYKLGEMDEMLLRKIEELTLYIIGLEKQVKELQQKTNVKGNE